MRVAMQRATAKSKYRIVFLFVAEWAKMCAKQIAMGITVVFLCVRLHTILKFVYTLAISQFLFRNSELPFRIHLLF